MKRLFCVTFALLGAYVSISASAQADLAATAAKETGAVVTPSGLVYRALKVGDGANPVATDVVKVHYRGTFASGEEFDSSYKRNEPAEFPLGGVIKCWTEGVQLMKVGGKAKLTCPSAIAYGSRGAGGGLIPPNTPLQFEVELLGIAKR
ncbi:MAG TPA: FKBP-type peptidyl-prolyl cis-trans isomerase [Burkholderiaceae bacterium]|nr:FKBP-type peptidyl-prolyl cis-trans isomerase [Burkholderiaceae bacterium]